MSTTVVCPACNSVNKPKAANCRVCGTRLTKGREKPAGGAPVVLERVMSGEVFTGVAGRVPKERLASERELKIREERLRASEAALRQRRPSPPAPVEPTTPAEAPGEAASEEPAGAPSIDVDGVEASARGKAPWVLKGETLLRAGRHFEAAAAFEEGLRINPDDERAWLGVCRALAAAKDVRGALESVDRAIEVDPDYGEAWLERGLLLEAMRDIAGALRSFARALELWPGNPIARAHIAALQGNVAAATGAAGGVAGGVEIQEERGVGEAPPTARSVEVGVSAAAPGSAAAGTPDSPAPGEVLRIRTFVDGLDEALGGGIPRGAVVVIEGTPGTMKSSLAASVLLHNAVREGRRGLYITLEESAASLVQQMRSLGLDPARGEHRIRFFDMRAMAGAIADPSGEWIDALRRVVAEANRGGPLELVVLDSLEALEVLAKFEDRRRQIYRLFEWLRDLGVTTFVIAERPDMVVRDVVVQGRWDEDFLADGVIQLRLHHVSELDVQRRLRVMKMRGTRHDTSYFALLLDEGRLRVTRAMAS